MMKDMAAELINCMEFSNEWKMSLVSERVKDFFKMEWMIQADLTWLGFENIATQWSISLADSENRDELKLPPRILSSIPSWK